MYPELMYRFFLNAPLLISKEVYKYLNESNKNRKSIAGKSDASKIDEYNRSDREHANGGIEAYCS